MANQGEMENLTTMAAGGSTVELPTTSTLTSATPQKRVKLSGYDFYIKVLGSPKFVVNKLIIHYD